jgi:hypothetical protein
VLSCGLVAEHRSKAEAFALVRGGVVGATGFEPVTSSVSANTGNRCARGRFPRSASTVEAEGKRSLEVKGNALFRHSTLPLLHARRSSSSAHESSFEAVHPASEGGRAELYLMTDDVAATVAAL